MQRITAEHIGLILEEYDISIERLIEILTAEEVWQYHEILMEFKVSADQIFEKILRSETAKYEQNGAILFGVENGVKAEYLMEYWEKKCNFYAPDIKLLLTRKDLNKYEIVSHIENFRDFGFDEITIEHLNGDTRAILYVISLMGQGDRFRFYKFIIKNGGTVDFGSAAARAKASSVANCLRDDPELLSDQVLIRAWDNCKSTGERHAIVTANLHFLFEKRSNFTTPRVQEIINVLGARKTIEELDFLMAHIHDVKTITKSLKGTIDYGGFEKLLDYGANAQDLIKLMDSSEVLAHVNDLITKNVWIDHIVEKLDFNKVTKLVIDHYLKPNEADILQIAVKLEHAYKEDGIDPEIFTSLIIGVHYTEEQMKKLVGEILSPKTIARNLDTLLRAGANPQQISKKILPQQPTDEVISIIWEADRKVTIRGLLDRLSVYTTGRNLETLNKYS